MPKAKTLKLKEGINIFNLSRDKKKLAKIHINVEGDIITIFPELVKGSMVEVELR